MAFKLIVFVAMLAYANAGFLPAAAPVSYAAPAASYAAPAASYAAPAASYAAPAVSYAAPAVSYAAPAVSYAAPAFTSQHANTFRSFGNLGQVSTYSKTIDTPFSSVSKADVRVSNPGFKFAAAAPIAHAVAPVAHAVAAPAAIGVAYSAAPAVSHVTYTGAGFSYGW